MNESKRTSTSVIAVAWCMPGVPCVAWWCMQCRQKNNTRDSNVVTHRSTNRARQCLTSQSERDAVLSLLYGRSWKQVVILRIDSIFHLRNLLYICGTVTSLSLVMHDKESVSVIRIALYSIIIIAR